MTLKQYIRIKLVEAAKMEDIYKEMMKRGHTHTEIYTTINEVIIENIKKLCNEYKKRRDSR